MFLFVFFFQAEDGIRDRLVLEFRRVLFRSDLDQSDRRIDLSSQFLGHHQRQLDASVVLVEIHESARQPRLFVNLLDPVRGVIRITVDRTEDQRAILCQNLMRRNRILTTAKEAAAKLPTILVGRSAEFQMIRIGLANLPILRVGRTDLSSKIGRASCRERV